MAASTLAGLSLTRFTPTVALSCTDNPAATRHVQVRSALPPLRLERRRQVRYSFRAAQSEIFGGQVAGEERRRLVRGFGVQLSGTLIVCLYWEGACADVLFSGKSRDFHSSSVQLSFEQIDCFHATSEVQRTWHFIKRLCMHGRLLKLHRRDGYATRCLRLRVWGQIIPAHLFW
jgi:hypothetical protein